ncbi:predicted protein [Uncinocarpus reesii 1704]|uniref:Uncharacterized protein n=1 Tax=Uncinocarpus reesii (strain UAMH 1704) TaxID=336963 RepID=C4JMB6_UNCRE|nr:uncharacterized protein UREG_03974 [Uncinocarpus reesii 1704]EEP79128.1 predicted protein [Uncinocarpus reesii 1704]
MAFALVKNFAPSFDFTMIIWFYTAVWNYYVMHTPCLEGLPTELKQLILAALPDVISLRAAALSCPAMYGAFMDAEHLLTLNVITFQLNPDIIQRAVLAHDVSIHGASWIPKETVDFERALRSRAHSILERRWTLSTALKISRTNDVVRYFTHDFASTMFSTPFAPEKREPGSWELSRQEINRIEIALYRFEIYSQLFKRPDEQAYSDDIFEIEKGLFHRMFPPWENEQLACVYEYLWERMEDAFMFFPRWSEYLVRVEEGIYSGCTAYHMARGLDYLYMIFHDPRILVSERYRSSLYFSQGWFLEDSLGTCTREQFYRTIADEIEDIRNSFPSSADADTGPLDAWAWARESETYWRLAVADERLPLRKWGYVMWDRARLEAWGVLQSTWGQHHADAVLEAASAQREKDMALIQRVADDFSVAWRYW